MHVVTGADDVLVADSDRLVDAVRDVGGIVTVRRVDPMWHDLRQRRVSAGRWPDRRWNV